MSLLHEVAVRAKYDGSFTQEWATIKRAVVAEAGLKNVLGKSDVEKLQPWAEDHGLLMSLEVESAGFSSAIRAVTFYNGGQAVVHADIDQPGTPDPSAVRDVGGAKAGADPVRVATAREYFDWDAVGCR